jgi:colicin import membrane protein
MPSVADRLEFAPPPPPGMLRAFVLAVLAHLLLLAALTWGVNWRSEPDTVAVEAELWSALPQQAAPKLVETPPPPPPPPAPTVQEVRPEPVLPLQADIALEREKKKQEEDRLRQQQDNEKKEKAAADQKKRLEAQKLEAQKKAEQDAQNRKEAEAARQATKDRQERIRQMQALAGASGGPGDTGTALRASGPSASYAGRIVARVKPNIVFTDDVSGNPTAEVEVRAAPDGTIVGRRLLKSSGVKSWDDAVLKAIDKTEVLPRDIDGRVPSSLVISFRPRD